MTSAQLKNRAIQGVGLLLAGIPVLSGFLNEPYKGALIALGTFLVGLGFRPASLSHSKDQAK